MAIQVMPIVAGMRLLKQYLDNAGSDNQTDKFLNANFKKTGSITKLLKTLIVEPTIIVSEEAKTSRAFDQAVNTSLNIFSSFYLQAFQILTQLNGKSGVEAIDILSTNNYKTNDLLKISASKLGGSALGYAANAAGYTLTTESFKTPTTLNQLDFTAPTMVLDQESIAAYKVNLEADTAREKESKELNSACIKVLEITISRENNERIKIPITVAATIKTVPQKELIKVVEDSNAKNSFLARWYEYRSGGITLGDFLFCGDLIKEYKKNKLDKASQLLGELSEQKGSSLARQALTGTKGAEVSYNTVILSELDAEYISKAFRQNITSYNGKQAYLSVMNAHNLTILDEDNERCKIYISDLQNSIDVGYNKLMKMGDGSKDNGFMLEMMKYFMTNKTPTF